MRRLEKSAVRVAGSLLIVAGCAIAFESVILQTPAASTTADYGVLLFGSGTVKKFGPGTSPINILNPAANLTSLVAFSQGLRPTYGTRTSGANTTLTFAAPLVIPLKVWVLCVNANCDGPFTDQVVDKMNTF